MGPTTAQSTMSSGECGRRYPTMSLSFVTNNGLNATSTPRSLSCAVNGANLCPAEQRQHLEPTAMISAYAYSLNERLEDEEGLSGNVRR